MVSQPKKTSQRLGERLFKDTSEGLLYKISKDPSKTHNKKTDLKI